MTSSIVTGGPSGSVTAATALVATVVGGAMFRAWLGHRRARRRLPVRASGRAGSPNGGGRLAAPLGVLGRASRRSRSEPRPWSRPFDDRVVGAVIVVGAVLAAIVHPLVGALVLVAATGPPALHRRAVRRRRAAAVIDELPDVVDLLHLALSAGLNLRLGLDVVVAHSEGHCAEVLASVISRVERGQRLVDALDALDVLGPPARPLHDALAAAERHGTPVLEPLGRVADEVRVRRRQRHDERARRLPVALLFPLVCCTLPALALVTVVPVIARPWIGPAP